MLDWSKLVAPGEVYVLAVGQDIVELSIDPNGACIGIEARGDSALLVASAGEARAMATGLMALAAYLDSQVPMPPAEPSVRGEDDGGELVDPATARPPWGLE